MLTRLVTHQFDKLLLTVILLILGAVLIRTPAEAAGWIKESFQIVLGAILALVGSSHYRKSDLKEVSPPAAHEDDD